VDTSMGKREVQSREPLLVVEYVSNFVASSLYTGSIQL
jgi:hypothetical protein